MLEVSPKLGPVHTPSVPGTCAPFTESHSAILLPSVSASAGGCDAAAQRRQALYSVAAGIGDEPGGNSGYAKSIKRKDDSAVAAIDALASEAQWLSIIGLSWRPSHFSLGIASAAYDAPE